MAELIFRHGAGYKKLTLAMRLSKTPALFIVIQILNLFQDIFGIGWAQHRRFGKQTKKVKSKK